MSSYQVKNKHLLWRAAFGPMVENVNQLRDIKPSRLWKQLVKDSSKDPKYIDVANDTVDGLVKGVQNLVQIDKLTADQKREAQKQARKKSTEDIKNLNLFWLSEMVNSKAQLREKMSLFWHGHFACRVINIYFQQQLLDVIRRNALGNFGNLLREVSKTPAMLSFLNNQQNKKQHPNENFAREVMELFTMGRGNYTEEDVRESARAYTGWGFNVQGEFVERKNLHDNGEKTFLGKRGNFDGDDILDIILEQKATAKFITRKIYTFLVNDQVDDDRLNKLAEGFYQSNYNILQLLENIFTSDWFFEPQNMGIRIKSPVELIAGIQRMIPVQFEQPQMQLLFERTLGQVLFYPPNVAGWPGGKSWIDSSTMVLRMRLPQIMTQNDSFTIKAKLDDDVMMGHEGINKAQTYKILTNINWDTIVNAFNNVRKEDLYSFISDYLLQTRSRVPSSVVDRFANISTRPAYIRSVIINIMSTPEYQLA
ncbi:MAG: DUF1800 domain-containing protein [Chitinophagaceae bacterium]|nr:DUF1800 domain-containing protein [Chitinophagaceae bacterium]